MVAMFLQLLLPRYIDSISCKGFVKKKKKNEQIIKDRKQAYAS